MTEYVSAYIGLGSNLGEPAKQLQQALDSLANIKQIKHIASSPWYRSTAVGPGNQPDYINAVASLKTCLSPHALLEAMQAIENQQGRIRDIRWGARTLDLDLLLYADITLHSDTLILPHPEISHRGFVLKPLHDLNPSIHLPDGASVAQLLSASNGHDLVPVEVY